MCQPFTYLKYDLQIFKRCHRDIMHMNFGCVKNKFNLNIFFFYFYRLVDIICDKMAEGGDNESSSTSNATNSAGNAGGGVPNLRGGPSTGATKLTDSSNNNMNNQGCQC